MTQGEFATLVGRLQGEAEAAPQAYRRRVGALAALGYAYLGVIVLVGLALLGGIGWALFEGETGRVALRKAGAAIGVLLYMIGRALFVRFAPFEGRELTRAEAPALFAELDALRKRLRTKKIHRVFVDNDMNASMGQRPRLGMLGFTENVLTLGLPLMQALSVEQFRAVIGHELGHLAGGDSRFSSEIYRQRLAWGRLLAKLEEENHWSQVLFKPFLRWYAPYFNAYSFVLARNAEYLADRHGASVASPQDLGAALINLSLKTTLWQKRLWARVNEMADTAPEPVDAPHARMGSALARGPKREDAEHWLPQYLAFETDLSDTHPCLRDRLAALGLAADVPMAVETSAASALLGEVHAVIAAEHDAAWHADIAERWRGHYAKQEAGRQRLAELDARSDLAQEEAWERFLLTEAHASFEAARMRANEMVRDFPDRIGAHFAAGRLALAAEDEAGVALLEHAMTLEDAAIIAGCEHIARFYQERGDASKAESYWTRAAEHQDRLDAIAHERDFLPRDLQYLAHGVDADALAVLHESLEATELVAKAWLVRKPLELSDAPLYVLGLWRRVHHWNPKTWGEDDEKEDAAMLDAILEGIECPGDTRIIVLNHQKRFRSIFDAVPGSQILG